MGKGTGANRRVPAGVGCASYAQRIPNLNELTGSDRLEGLLREDLAIRINERNRRGSNSPNRRTFNKEKMTTAQKENAKKENPKKKKGNKPGNKK